MSDYSSNFPQQRPKLNLVFNSGSDKLDSRISYTRSSTGTAFSAEKHLSTLNLLKYSTAFDNAAWVTNNMPAPTTGQTDPSGGTGGCILIADTTNGSHNKFQSQVITGDLNFTVYAKPASGTMRMMLNLYNASNDWEVFLFDLVGGTPVAASGTSSTFSNVSATQTASGNGYYKCTIKATGSITSAILALNPNATTSGLNAYGGISFAGDDTAGITVAFASLSTVGSSDYNATTSQIHRSFAPTLKSYSSDQPRFEYSASDGQSEGLLIEAQASNLYPNSSDMTGNSGALTNVDLNVAVGPTGDLTADALRLDATDANAHYRQYNFTASASTAYTFSVYVKADGLNYIAVRSNNLFASNFTYFNLSNGTVEGSPSMTSTIESVGNGWYRVSVNATTTGSGTASFIIYITDSASSTTVATGDSYRAVLGTGLQVEAASTPSSLISTSGSTATRSADSCSVATADFGYTGGPVSVISEFAGGSGYYPELWELRDTVSKAGGVNDYILPIKYSASASSSTNWQTWINDSGNLSQTTLGASSSATKLGVSVDTNSVASCADGGTIYDTTSTVIPDSLDTLYIGRAYASTIALNGHIKRLSLFNVALSDVELQSLTSNP